jgi:outer membrane PBP1 activator LpoA protein
LKARRRRDAMFCPQCKAEYRSGYRRCSDCDVDLVDELPPTQGEESAQATQLNDPRTIWTGDSATDCVSECETLKEAGIPYEVSQFVKDRRQRMQVIWRYELAVSREDEQRAKELLQLPETVADSSSETTEEEAHQAPLEYPEHFDDDFDLDEARRRRQYLDAFDPGDACDEIWQVPPGERSAIESSLKENYIRMRAEPQPDGSRKLFVLPEDAAIAREIVREIEGGAPPA